MNRWLIGARLRTLPAAVVPVVVGSAVAVHDGNFVWWRALLCLVVALALQVGVNYANDYSDGVRGTDAERVGPARLVGSGLAAPAAVKRAAFLCFAVGAVAGAALSLAVNPWLLLVGVACIAAAWFYTGGSNPYGYKGLGEVAVFVFFGLVATVGTAYVQTGRITSDAVISGVGVGSLAVALLIANNLRDRPKDEAAGKRTLAVVMGERPTRILYQCCTAVVPGIAIAVLFGMGRNMLPALGYYLIAPVGKVNMAVHKGASGAALVPVLQATARCQIVFGALFALGVAL